MINIPTNNIISINEDYSAVRARHPGRSIAIEVSGIFDGATVTSGYVSNDTTPVFVLDEDESGNAKTKTSIGRWITLLPKSGKFALRVTGAGGATAIRVSTSDISPH